MHVLQDASIAGVWRVGPTGSAPEAFPRPWIGVLAGLHGDEPCGVEALAALRDRFATTDLLRGSLVLIHGNLAAKGTRHTDGGVDLNRVFDLSFRESLPEAEWCSEHRRALELAPVLDELDGALDLHSASAPTEPFAIAMRGGVDVARGLGLEFVTHGWEDSSDIAEGVAVSRVARRGLPAMGVECGSHADPSGLATALRVVDGFLGTLGLLPPVSTPHAEPKVLEIFASIPRPDADWRFAQPLLGFAKLSEGDLIGPGVVAPKDCVALLPNDQVDVGKPCLYLAHP